MKNIIFLLISSFIYASSYAQDPQLFENDWYLHKIIINGTEFFPPGANGEATTINLYIDQNIVGSTVCDTTGAEITIFDDVNSAFSVGFFSSLAVDCLYYENQIFQDRYFNDFFKWMEPTNTYQYQIDTGTNNSKTLTLFNADNNQAIYGNEPLSTQDFSKINFAVFPNPALDEIIIISADKVNTKLKIKIFTTDGKLINAQELEFEHKGSLDISDLSKGIYFLSMENENGNLEVKKFIKK